MDEGIVLANRDASMRTASSNGIGTNGHDFVVILRPTGNVVSLNMRDICELDESSSGLTSLSCLAL